MSAFFPGSRAAGPLRFEFGKKILEYQYTERWINKDRSHTVRCGQSSKLSLSITVGISETESESFKDFMEGSLGPSAVASLKSHIESSTKSEFTLSHSVTEANEFTCPAPSCGSQTHTLYQLVRDYDFAFTKQRRFFGPVMKSAALREYTRNFDLQFEEDKNDPSCPCKPTLRRPRFEEVSFDVGDNLTIRIDALMRPDNSASFLIGEYEVTTPISQEDGKFSTKIDADQLPDFVRYLSGVGSGLITVSGGLSSAGFDPALLHTDRLTEPLSALNPTVLQELSDRGSESET